MTQLDKSASTVGEATAPPPRAAHRSRLKRIFIAIAALAALITLAAMNHPEPLLIALGLGLPAYFVWYGIRTIRRSRPSDEEMEEEWRRRKALEDEMVQIADEAFAANLFGTWQDRTISYPEYGAPKIHRERIIELRENGTGAYRWIDHDLGSHGQTEFAFTRPEKNMIDVRLRALPARDCYRVPFSFEAHKVSTGKMELRLYFDAKNPLPPDLQLHWPFDLSFTHEQ